MAEDDFAHRFPGVPVPGDALAALLLGYRIQARPVLAALELLGTGWRTADELIAETGLEHRAVTELIAAGKNEIQQRDNRFRLTDDWTIPRQDRPTPTPDHDLITALAAEIAAAPAPLAALDHVPATAATVAGRASWLRASYWLPGAHLLCLGDHDLTSLALGIQAARTGERIAITVLDVDERLLEFLDARAAALGLPLRCVHADLRFGLPPALTSSADLVFTDPPYSPAGMALFVSRGLATLADPTTGRVLAAYGYATRAPGLGEKVQQAVQATGVAFEAILPGFNRYTGAPALGAASDLYVCQPTSRGVRAAAGIGIYTRGPAAVESAATDPEAQRGLRAALDEPGATVRGPGWAEPVTGTLAAFDLDHDPGPWLLRTLLACNASRVGLLLANNHPDIADGRGQRALATLLGAKYALRFLRSTPDPKHAVLIATARTDGRVATAELLHRVHGKLGNVLREALVTASATEPTGTLSKREARARVTELLATAGLPADDAELRLIDLPRHRIAALLDTLG